MPVYQKGQFVYHLGTLDVVYSIWFLYILQNISMVIQLQMAHASLRPKEIASQGKGGTLTIPCKKF